MSASQASVNGAVPILLLKTRSSPGDSYEDLFESTNEDGWSFEPTFVPVLQHTLIREGLDEVRTLLQNRGIRSDEGASYGGLIFTSQRAVEAFTSLSVPVYSVAPRRRGAWSPGPRTPPLAIHGSHTGNGDALAAFILDDYAVARYPARVPKPPLLFLVGEQRRDIIPRTLTDPTLPADRRIPVTEGDRLRHGASCPRSPDHLARLLDETASRPVRWVVVFSPTGCDSLLRGLGLLDEASGRARPAEARDGRTYVATIGPTTRDYLRRTFGFEPDVCAATPSPEGVRRAIVDFTTSHSGSKE
ncbi:uroporphyrinogen-III synthase [Verticillium alfalfae VaMs.102]|uniref:Uroporphyrinogen-III synthase n=1 Tax=Verticillium alfalfae (strain VaMs.102 / ATCC MYA-4576 / FGSC 10136) TaxID=526221 RepID=C9SXT1_VERA1|nr:uroporphyrinogen-III synthase [Verticillium alfalfae VaMs.102]EEY23596.1 uroporphyrinogen-III synthase [Verticillium alfalfae VaMs.102]